MSGDTSYALAGVAVLVAVFMVGGLAGFLVAASHEVRMLKWAAGVERVTRWLLEAEEKGNAAAVADLRRRLGLGDEAQAQEHAVGVERVGSSVPVESSAAVVHARPGSPAVSS